MSDIISPIDDANMRMDALRFARSVSEDLAINVCRDLPDRTPIKATIDELIAVADIIAAFVLKGTVPATANITEPFRLIGTQANGTAYRFTQADPTPECPGGPQP